MVATRGGKILSIETGYSCNALCGFCPQVTFRSRNTAHDKADQTTDEIKATIKEGADNGYTQLGFSGGEPTIRKDFIELVAYGKSLGYELIAVTTNGMRFSYLKYAQALVKAGLNSVNISIHGATAGTHNAMMRTPEAFELAIQGIKNLQGIRQRTGLRIDFMSMCLAAPQVLNEFPDHIRLMGELGIRLHMVQPLLINPGNSNFSHRMMSSYEDIAKAIRAGVEVAKLHNGHIKLFNTPVCMFWDIEEHLERQQKPLNVSRISGLKPADVNRLEAMDGYYRTEDCKTCIEPCNGFRIEYFSQSKMLDGIKQSIVEKQKDNRTNGLWLGGTTLLEPDSWNQLMGFAREVDVTRLSLLTEGLGRTYGENFTKENLKHIDEISFRVRGRRTKRQQSVPYLQLHGNLVDVEKSVARINSSDTRPLVSATLFPMDLFSKEVLDFVARTPFDSVRIFSHYSPYSAELMVVWPFLFWKILRVAKHFRAAGKNVILVGSHKPLLGRGFVWESFWDQWVEHPWVNPPHPDIYQPILWYTMKERWRIRVKRVKREERNVSFFGPPPLSDMPQSPKVVKTV